MASWAPAAAATQPSASGRSHSSRPGMEAVVMVKTEHNPGGRSHARNAESGLNCDIVTPAMKQLTLFAILASLLVVQPRPRAAEPAPGPWTLWYRQPASQWVEALPIGNGRLAAMVFGGTSEERLQL